MNTLVKICGITNSEDALYACELNVWALGFVFYKESPRFVKEAQVKDIVEKLPTTIAKVGLFVNEDIEMIKSIASSCKLDMVQLHGDEDPEFCKKVMKFTRVIKAFRLKDKDSVNAMPNYDVDLCLLDTYVKDIPGGTGKTFNLDLAVLAKKYGKKIILAGGLNPGNIIDAIRKVEPYAVDISSGVEEKPGKKSKTLMKELMDKLNGGR